MGVNALTSPAIKIENISSSIRLQCTEDKFLEEPHYVLVSEVTGERTLYSKHARSRNSQQS